MSLSLAPIILLAAAESLTYHITVTGPDGELDRRCQDPCHIEQVQVVGRTSGGTTTETAQVRDDVADRRGMDCQGDCDSGRSTELRINIRMSRTLREGIEVRIEGQRAHLIFYDVAETESGHSTRRRHAQFAVDRELIELDLHGSEVRLETTGLGDGG